MRLDCPFQDSPTITFNFICYSVPLVWVLTLRKEEEGLNFEGRTRYRCCVINHNIIPEPQDKSYGSLWHLHAFNSLLEIDFSELENP